MLLGEAFTDIKKGDIEKGFAQADTIVEFRSERRLHTWIGPERPCGVFRWNGDAVEVWVKQQRPHIAKRVISSWFGGVPTNKIQVHCLVPGGQFRGMESGQLEFRRPLLRRPAGQTHRQAGQVDLHPPGRFLRRGDG